MAIHASSSINAGLNYGSIPLSDNLGETNEKDLSFPNDVSTPRPWFWRSSLVMVLLTALLGLSSWLPNGHDDIQAKLVVTLYEEQKSTNVASDTDTDTDPGRIVTPSGQSRSILLDETYDEEELYYPDQFVDHINYDTEHSSYQLKTYSQRYYKKSKHWYGPGYPILMIIGGEDELLTPMLYPFVNEGLASEFHAFVISPEHRFYGESQPAGDNATVDEMIQYLTPDQALLDCVNLLQFLRDELHCSINPESKHYCPVITFGGSYPGFLSTMLRYRFPDYVDISYASSAPLLLYSQEVDANAYYDKITQVADVASPGCSTAVRNTLYAVQDELLERAFSTNDARTSVLQAATDIGFCPDTFPAYIQDIPELISETITYLVPAMFADYDMFYYPPGPDTALTRACSIFQDDQQYRSPLDRLSNFFKFRNVAEYQDTSNDVQCFDLSLELPSGPNARIRGADNSGSGGGPTGKIWEFQCCKDLIIRAGYSPQSMFLPRPFSYPWHLQHCEERFPGIPVEPYRMVNQWGFNDILHSAPTSYILFVNGLQDGWSTSSILSLPDDANPNLAVLNLPNGAHHSELSPIYPNPDDTDDVKKGHETITTILGQWLDEIYEQQV